VRCGRPQYATRHYANALDQCRRFGSKSLSTSSFEQRRAPPRRFFHLPTNIIDRLLCMIVYIAMQNSSGAAFPPTRGIFNLLFACESLLRTTRCPGVLLFLRHCDTLRFPPVAEDGADGGRNLDPPRLPSGWNRRHIPNGAHSKNVFANAKHEATIDHFFCHSSLFNRGSSNIRPVCRSSGTFRRPRRIPAQGQKRDTPRKHQKEKRARGWASGTSIAGAS